MTNPAELSPMSMAHAAYTAAVAKNNRNRDDCAIDSPGEGNVTNHAGSLFPESWDNDAGRASNVGARIDEIWKSCKGDADATLAETLRLLVGELDSLVQCGLGAFHDLDATTRQLAQSREFAETRSRDAQRFHSIDEQSRASLSVSERADILCDIASLRYLCIPISISHCLQSKSFYLNARACCERWNPQRPRYETLLDPFK